MPWERGWAPGAGPCFVDQASSMSGRGPGRGAQVLQGVVEAEGGPVHGAALQQRLEAVPEAEAALPPALEEGEGEVPHQRHPGPADRGARSIGLEAAVAVRLRQKAEEGVAQGLRPQGAPRRGAPGGPRRRGAPLLARAPPSVQPLILCSGCESDGVHPDRCGHDYHCEDDQQEEEKAD